MLKLKDALLTSGEVELHDLLVREVVQVLDHASQRVPVRRNQDPLPGPGQQARSKIERKKGMIF
jgi:hypothetical protein